jgi:hypothetical protein
MSTLLEQAILPLEISELESRLQSLRKIESKMKSIKENEWELIVETETKRRKTKQPRFSENFLKKVRLSIEKTELGVGSILI